MKILLSKEEYEKKIVNKYSDAQCFTNHAGHEKEHFLNSLKMSSRGRLGLDSYLNSSDAQKFKHVLVSAKHFSNHVNNKNKKRFWFIKKFKHVPTIASPSQMFLMGFYIETIKVQRKPPKARIFQEDQLEAFKKQDIITIIKFG